MIWDKRRSHEHFSQSSSMKRKILSEQTHRHCSWAQSHQRRNSERVFGARAAHGSPPSGSKLRQGVGRGVGPHTVPQASERARRRRERQPGGRLGALWRKRGVLWKRSAAKRMKFLKFQTVGGIDDRISIMSLQALFRQISLCCALPGRGLRLPHLSFLWRQSCFTSHAHFAAASITNERRHFETVVRSDRHATLVGVKS